MSARVDQKIARKTQPDHLWAECWCQTDVVEVPVSEVRQCRTRSCGLPHCKEPQQ